MPDKSENERRKQIMDELQKVEEQNFENSLPMSRDNFKQLFEYLDIELSEKNCDDTNDLTKSFLLKKINVNPEKIIEWLANYGGNCDCEILNNVEERFD